MKSGPGRGLERLPLKLLEENSMKTVEEWSWLKSGPGRGVERLPLK